MSGYGGLKQKADSEHYIKMIGAIHAVGYDVGQIDFYNNIVHIQHGLNILHKCDDGLIRGGCHYFCKSCYAPRADILVSDEEFLRKINE